MTVRPYPLRLTERAGAARSAPSLLGRVLRGPAPGAPDSLSTSILGDGDQRVANGSFAGQHLADVAASRQSWLEGGAGLSHRVTFIDSSGGTAVRVSDSEVICHVLWCANERSAYVLAGVDPLANACTEVAPDRLIRRSVSPGDTISIPAGMPHALGPGVLAYQLSVQASSGQQPPDPIPTHGLSRFHGFNRRTTCAAGPEFLLERLKVTQPLHLQRPHDRWMFVTNLVDPLAISWDGGTDLIGRAESRLLPASLRECTFVPSGVAYVLCVSVPDLTHDVVAPLRQAGYRDDEIAALGTMRSALDSAR